VTDTSDKVKILFYWYPEDNTESTSYAHFSSFNILHCLCPTY